MNAMHLAAVTLLSQTIGQNIASPKPSDFVASGDYVYGMLLPPKVVSTASVMRGVWSADGRYLAGVRQDIKMTDAEFNNLLTGQQKTLPEAYWCVFVWSKTSGKNVEALRESALSSQFQSIGWIGETDTVWVQLATSVRSQEGQPPTHRTRLLLIKASSGNTREILLPALEYISWVHPFDRDGRVALISQAVIQKEGLRAPYSLRFIDSQGNLTSPIVFPEGSHFGGFSEKGEIYALRPERQEETEGSKPAMKLNWSVFNSRTQRFEPVPANAAPKQPFEQPRIARELQISNIARGASDGLSPLYLLSNGDKEPRKALITAEAQFAELSPTLDAVFYVTRGIGLVRPISKMSRKFYDDSMAAAQRAEAMGRAKQVALAAIIYSADHDDMLPGSSSDWMGLLDPYLKNSKLFDGFNYTFPGGSLRSVERPSETEMGYIMMQGGRVVVYVDGHVKWIPD